MNLKILARCTIYSTFLPITFLFAALRIQSVSPKSQSMTASLAPEIKIEFDAPVDAATINARSITIFGRWAGVMPGEFRLENGNRQLRFLPAKKFSAGEWITVAISKRIRSATGDSLSAGYTWNFWTQAGRGDMTLRLKNQMPVRFANEPPVRTYGAFAGDLNGDGYHDFTVPNEDANDIRVYFNDGKGNYAFSSRHPLTPPARPSTNEGADFNGDAITDFAVGNIRGNSVGVLLGDGRGGFRTPVNYPVDLEPRGLSVMDLEGDGDMDIVTANRVGNSMAILYNRGDGTFSPRTIIDSGGGNETACAAADANEDGILDLFVGAYTGQEIILLLGDGKGGLKFSARIDCGGSPWMVAAGDVDGDGHVDVAAANASPSRAAIIRGDGKGGLLPVQTYPVGAFPLGIDLGDLNGDGDLDLVTSNYSGKSWTLYENAGNGTFINPQSFPATTAASCAVFHDRDLDGDLDMTGIDEEADVIFLFENPAATAVGEKQAVELPQDFILGQAYPNPFALAATHNTKLENINIPFTLQRTAKINLRVANVLGQTVAVLVNGILAAGAHQAQLPAHEFQRGVYFYILEVEGKKLVKKIAIL
jgi:hypothetical protein